MRKVGLHLENKWLYDWVMNGITDGFSIYMNDDASLDSNTNNLPTSAEDEVRITEWLLNSLNKGWILGPFLEGQNSVFDNNVHINPLGCVPKKGGKIRPIVHCSAPRHGKSVNSEMIEEWKTVKYTSFREVCELVKSVGKDGWLWSADAADAYLQLSIRKEDCNYLAVRWLGLTLVFCVLIFGLSSAPKIYTLFADTIQKIVVGLKPELFGGLSGQKLLIQHYLDDFFGGCNTKSDADKQFQHFLNTLSHLNVPFAPKKCIPPNQSLIILGLCYDTRDMSVSIPSAKYEEMKEKLLNLSNSKSTTKKHLLCIVGKLRWFSVAIFGSSAFVRRIERKAHSVRRLEHHVKITSSVKKDLKFWINGFHTLNRGIPLDFILKSRSVADIHVYSDASSRVGFGAVDDTGDFFHCRWSVFDQKRSSISDIFLGEMLAAVTYFVAKKEVLSGKTIVLYTDNSGVEWSLRKKHCKFDRPDIMSLIRTICDCAVRFRFYFWVEHVSTHNNRLADALSRFDYKSMSSLSLDPVWKNFPLTNNIWSDTLFNFCSSHVSSAVML